MRTPSSGGSAELSVERLRRRLEGLLSTAGTQDSAGTQGSTGSAAARTAEPGAEPPDQTRSASASRGFSSRHLVVVAAVALVGCLWAGASLLSARTVAVPISATAITTAGTPSDAPASRIGAPGGVTSASPMANSGSEIVVHVLGAVRKPGLVHLRNRSRVADALAAAGGLRADARPGELNLAAFVADGAQIVIGTAASPGGAVRVQHAGSTDGTAGTGGLVDLNRASSDELEKLPGVGPVTAQAILAWREQHRFARVEELQQVAGIGPKTYAKLAALVTV